MKFQNISIIIFLLLINCSTNERSWVTQKKIESRINSYFELRIDVLLDDISTTIVSSKIKEQKFERLYSEEIKKFVGDFKYLKSNIHGNNFGIAYNLISGKSTTINEYSDFELKFMILEELIEKYNKMILENSSLDHDENSTNALNIYVPDTIYECCNRIAFLKYEYGLELDTSIVQQVQIEINDVNTNYQIKNFPFVSIPKSSSEINSIKLSYMETNPVTAMKNLTQKTKTYRYLTTKNNR